jgi:hypothetical protein
MFQNLNNLYNIISHFFQIIQLFYLNFLKLFIKIEKQPLKIKVEIDPISEYINTKKKWFIKKYEPKLNEKLNENIDEFFYNKNNLFKMLKNETNLIEKIWKTRILYENTPRGNVIMYYDVYKFGFTYYSDQTIPYCILNAVAMKYSIIFCCRHFFMDEVTTIEAKNAFFPKLENNEQQENQDLEKQQYNFVSPLIKIYFEEEKKEEPTEKTKIDAKELIKNAPLAKLKNYKMTTVKNSDNTTVAALPVLLKNKFIYLGKTMNYFILQKQIKPQNIGLSKTSEFNSLFSETTISTEPYINKENPKIKKLSWKDYKTNITM